MKVRDKRINDFGNVVFDVWDDAGRIFKATVEIRDDAPGGMRVLLGALQPAGKEQVMEAICRYDYQQIA